jgi:biotin synthase
MTTSPEADAELRGHVLKILAGETALYAALAEAAELRERYFGKTVRIHILDNIQNGRCAEDCGYCAQRKGADSGIEPYALKSSEAIFEEAKSARDSGAYRFCMVTAGTGPSANRSEELAQLIAKITQELGMRVCLSAGLVDGQKAELFAKAGLDRYNHNLNTAEEHYGEICSTHTYRDRVATLENLQGAGVGLCSGVIVGLGESAEHLVDAAFELKRLGVVSIPVNFFIPVPGHAVQRPQQLTPEFCLRVLIAFRLINPEAEIRIAAGREGHLRSLQAPALMVANSLFASGYLNVKGSNLNETLQLIADAGFAAETESGVALTQRGEAGGYSEERVKQLLKFPKVSS